MFDSYSAEKKRLSGLSLDELTEQINRDSDKIKWTTDVITDLKRGREFSFDDSKVTSSVYRPYTKQKWYSDPNWNWTRHLMPRFFPNESVKNLCIQVSGTGARSGFSALMIDRMSEVQNVDNGQCFPLKIYEKFEEADGLFSADETSRGYRARDGITNNGLKHFQAAYPGEEIAKEDVFYYVYGLLHSDEYRSRYADNLSKELPRIPCVKKAEDFWAFSRAGRTLGELHVNYESVDPYSATIRQGDLRTAVIKDPEAFYRVTKMKFGGNAREKDKSTVIYNGNITMQGIPLEAYDYVVNGKPALEWVMERQIVKTDKASGIVNDANRYAIETMGNPAYPLELFQRVITVGLETMKIVRELPKLEID